MTSPDRAPAELRRGAIGFVDALVIGLASTSPAYSLAAVMGAVVALVGVYAPGVFLASFLPMLLIASAFYYLNRADQDCGTTFSWVTRAMGPWFGWLGGWAISMTGVLVIGSLAEVGVRFGLLSLQLDGIADTTWAVRTLSVLLILAMTAVCVIGTEVSARFQNVLIIAQVVALLAFAAVALVKGLGGDAVEGGGLSPSWSWLNPFGAGGAALTGGLLLGVFIYWGWESAVNLTEETQDSASAPGRAGVVSTVVLLVTYLAVAYAVLVYSGTDYLEANAEEAEDLFVLLARDVLGGWDWVLLLAISTSAIASTQTTILPASRTGLSMARRHALPPGLARIHPRFRTPDVSTWTVAGIASAWYVVVNLISENALFDSITALSLLIAFYYSLTGIACAVFHRDRLTRSVRDALLIGVGPLVGAGLLIWLLVESIGDLSDPANSDSGVAWFGLGPPLVIGIGIFALGIVVMLCWRVRDRRFWTEQRTTADRLEADVAAGRSGASVVDPAP
ncbi:amino acid permease [Modestobacter sp. I12A-02628]|uniref:APC family permease n=1 Tax=Goekera deserti TaxID=2497753 RepID=A0A7K3W9U6_9ACTN|nr:APC family permease [Goekera deserti]MPQ98915.1 amino acid permease [Goekera deserti]NDI49586.1 amino acid permease [Goekera deserti]NEL53221.1 APC family permease [Goekera deserti]